MGIPGPPLRLDWGSSSCLPAIHSLRCFHVRPVLVLGRRPYPSVVGASLFRIWSLLEHTWRAHAATSPCLSLLAWKSNPPHHPILWLNSPSPFKILLKHLPLLVAFPTPLQLDIHPSLLVRETVAMFAELLEAEFHGLCINSQGPLLSSNKTLIQALVPSLCPQEAHRLVWKMWANRIHNGKCSDMEDRPPSRDGLGLVG